MLISLWKRLVCFLWLLVTSIFSCHQSFCVLAGKAKPSKEEINFDSDEDLPGLDDSQENTPRDSPIPPTRSKKEQTSKKETQGTSGDIFGDDDDLPGTGIAKMLS